jgi:hypothetical protein
MGQEMIAINYALQGNPHASWWGQDLARRLSSARFAGRNNCSVDYISGQIKFMHITQTL